MSEKSLERLLGLRRMARLRERVRVAWAVCSAGFAAGACSGGPPPAAPGWDGGGSDGGASAAADAEGASDPYDGAIGCANDPRARSYASGLSVMGEAGALSFTLVRAAPAPPALDSNVWTIAIIDPATGILAPGASVTHVTTWMPDHGHGSSVLPQATANSDGTYDVSVLYLFMPGLWQITVTAEAPQVQDSAVFSFCIGG